MAPTRDTFMTFAELIGELARNCRCAQAALRRRLQQEDDFHGELVAWVLDQQDALLKGLDDLVDRGPDELLQRRVQYTLDSSLRNAPSGEGLLPWVLNINNEALEALSDLGDKTLAPEAEESIEDLETQFEGINRRIAMSLNTAQDL